MIVFGMCEGEVDNKSRICLWRSFRKFCYYVGLKSYCSKDLNTNNNSWHDFCFLLKLSTYIGLKWFCK